MNTRWFLAFFTVIIWTVSALQETPSPDESKTLGGGMIFLIILCVTLIALGIVAIVLYWLSGSNIKVRKVLMKVFPERFLRTPHFDEHSANYQKLEETYGDNLFDDDSDDFLEEDASVLDPEDL